MPAHIKQYLGLSCLLAALIGSAVADSRSRLADHPSPYLNLHASDPVAWRVWGKDVLELAREQNKLVFLSIGYFACHWCHVMQRESYKDNEVGAFLNEHFIAVKVDRELRPDLDRRMIRFVEEVNGVAGWPLNVFLTGEGYPVTGFTYLPRDDFLALLRKLQGQWVERRAEISTAAEDYFASLQQSPGGAELLSLPDQHFDRVVDAFVSQAMLLADEMQGGFGQTTKFPSYPQLKALLALISRNARLDPDVVSFVRLTLDAMAGHHLMDHVNGGFFRYVTDPDWQTPHFEKMLYDNAQLALLYFSADALWPNEGYREVALRTVDFMLRDLADAAGGFNASLSAVDDSDVEGGAYYWSPAELREVLDEAAYQRAVQDWQLVEGRSLLIPELDPDADAELLRRLRAADKPAVPVDDKKLAAWNALALEALLMAERHQPGDGRRRDTDRLYHFIERNFLRDDGVVRLAGAASQAETTLADYAYLAHALQSFANARGDKAAGKQARSLVHQAFKRFQRDGLWLQDPDSLIPGLRGDWVIQDEVLESPSSVLLETLLIMPGAQAIEQVDTSDMIRRLTRDMLDLPFHYASAIMLRQRLQADTKITRP